MIPFNIFVDYYLYPLRPTRHSSIAQWRRFLQRFNNAMLVKKTTEENSLQMSWTERRDDFRVWGDITVLCFIFRHLIGFQRNAKRAFGSNRRNISFQAPQSDNSQVEFRWCDRRPIGLFVFVSGTLLGPMTRFLFFISFAGQMLCSSYWGALSNERVTRVVRVAEDSLLRLLGSLSVASYGLQGLRWKYSNPPPHGVSDTVFTKCSPFQNPIFHVVHQQMQKVRHLWTDCLENVESSTSHNPIGLHGLLRISLFFLMPDSNQF
jgi:hypothetical protein